MKDIVRNILFIMPPVCPANEMMGKNLAPYKEIPYGLLSLAAYLKKYCKIRINVEILDLNVADSNRFQEDIDQTMERFNPEIVGISGLFNSMFNYVNEFSSCIKEKYPNVLLVVGGNVSTNCYDLLFKLNKYIDGACYAEGEVPMLLLAEATNPFDALENCPSWITRNKVSAGKVPSPTFIESLDEIPPLDYSMITLDKYDSRCRNNNPVNHNEEHAIRLPFITTRGCPFNCVFCAASSLSGKKVRFVSAERVIADIKRAKEKYKMTRIVINDDQALIDKDRIKKILTAIADLNLVLEFPSGLNAKFVDEEMAIKLKRAGLDVANLAIESGSEYVLKNIINKPLKMSDIRPAVAALRKNGLFVHGFFIFGFPGERDSDRNATVDLIKDVGFDWSNIYVAAPLRGSRLYKICVDKGYISGDDDILQATIYESSIKTSEIVPEVITKYVYRVNLDVNFVNNYRMKTGDYEIAKGYFSNVVKNHPSHAFAHYYLARAYEGLGSDKTLIAKHMDLFYEIIKTDNEWAEYAREFKLASNDAPSTLSAN
ncbi:MAG TPA: radical SAM protein [Thermodesulfovibrionales bacterium]|nr:radical SAM protein [Thermodesulfovibrionales bacterium]